MDIYEIQGEVNFHYADPDPEICRCRGNGWILSTWDVYVKCTFHRPSGESPEADPS